jgi:hypothetical protein
MLDEGFRRRFGELGDDGQSSLDEAARERIFERVRVEGPALVARAKRRRTWNMVSVVAAAAAVAAGVAVLRHPQSGAPGAKSASGNAALVCASRAPAESAQGFVQGTEGARLDLGVTALAVTSKGSTVRLAEASACRTIIELDSGSIAVHAKDLGGGELRVHSPEGDVIVHGTIFSVTEDERGLSVEVVVGNVTVTSRDDVHSVTTGHRLLLSKVGAAEGPLTAERERAVREALGVPAVVGLEALPPTAAAVPAAPVPGAPAPRVAMQAPRTEEATKSAAPMPVPEVQLETEEPPSAAAPPAPPADLLAMAEKSRRAGDYTQARDLYRRAAVGANVTAEAAWVALARMELSLGHAAQALEATKRRQERFGRGTLSPEALWIDVRSYRQMGDLARARELAGKLVDQWPGSPQARAAQQWLGGS